MLLLLLVVVVLVVVMGAVSRTLRPSGVGEHCICVALLLLLQSSIVAWAPSQAGQDKCPSWGQLGLDEVPAAA